MGVTIKDVARLSRVSIGTVSHVSNEVPTVDRVIRKRVLKAIRELNYKPNRVAKSLVTGQSQTLAFIIPDICNPFFPEMVQAATDKAGEFGYSLFLGNIGRHPKREIEFIRNFISQGVDGLIIATSDYSDYSAEELDQVKAIDLPIVMVDRDIPSLDQDLVILDNVRSAQIVMTHLVNLGFRQIGMIMGPLKTLTARERLEGGRRILQEKGLYREDLIYCGDFTFENGFQTMSKWLAEGKKIEAVFCADDMIAIGAMKAIDQMGYRIPEDIAVTGFDDLYLSSLLKPPLTAIHQPIYDLGSIAVQMVIERIQGKAPQLPRKVVICGELVIRGSTVKPSNTI
jgi:LacI family transcriptional regulator